MGTAASAVIVVVASAKGGAGKSTMAANLTVGIAAAGQSVGIIDLDWRQRTLTNWHTRRMRAVPPADAPLVGVAHETVRPSLFDSISLNEEREFEALAGAVERLDALSDVIVCDTAAGDSYLSRLAHQVADIVVTPIEDSTVDRDALAGAVEGLTGGEGPGGQRAIMEQARAARDTGKDSAIDWIVARNRKRDGGLRLPPVFRHPLDAMAGELGFRVTTGLCERRIYRDLFAAGMAAFDPPMRGPSGLHYATVSERAGARDEIGALIAALHLPFALPNLGLQPQAEHFVPAE